MNAIATLLVFGLGAGLTAAVEPDSDSSGRALFFSEPNFKGECLIVPSGSEIRDLAGTHGSNGWRWDDRIVSVRLEGRITVTLFADPRFRGENTELHHSIPDLARLALNREGPRTWAHETSSLRVALGNLAEAPSGVEIDRLVVSAYRDVLGRDPDFAGLQNYRRRLADEGWSEERLRSALKASREFRQRDLEAIVRRAYQLELGRGPDPGGLSTYLGALSEKGWTEGDLRRELRRSAEGRDVAVRRTVRQAYREILGREPDPEGLAHYSKLLHAGWTERQLREHLKSSEEYRRRQSSPKTKPR